MSATITFFWTLYFFFLMTNGQDSFIGRGTTQLLYCHRTKWSYYLLFGPLVDYCARSWYTAIACLRGEVNHINISSNALMTISRNSRQNPRSHPCKHKRLEKKSHRLLWQCTRYFWFYILLLPQIQKHLLPSHVKRCRNFLFIRSQPENINKKFLSTTKKLHRNQMFNAMNFKMFLQQVMPRSSLQSVW